jgi:hypothetical protein
VLLPIIDENDADWEDEVSDYGYSSANGGNVQHLIATAAVDSDPEIWTAAARTQVYDPWYLGCSR